jgi:hypothetical protein
MPKYQRRKVLIFALIFILIAALVVCGVLFLTHRKKAEQGGKLGVAGLDCGKYTCIYVKRTSYQDTNFTVYNDSLLKDGTHVVDFGLENQEFDVPDYGIFDPYSMKYPTNTVTEQYLSEGQYNKRIDGYDSFQTNLTMTTIILRKGEHGKYGYAYTVVEFGKQPKPVKQDVQKYLDMIQSGKDISEAFKMNLSGDRLDQYIDKNNIKIYYNKKK